MSLRAKLIFSFLLLSVVPLTALVLYSYVSSLTTLRQVAWEENNRLADEMSQRMGVVEQTLSRRFEGLAGLPLERLVETDQPEADRRATLAQVSIALGEIAPLVAGLEFVPEPPPAERGGPAPPGPKAAALAPPPPRIILLGQEAVPGQQAAEAFRKGGVEIGIAVRRIVSLSAQAGAAGLEQALPAMEAAIEQATAELRAAAPRAPEPPELGMPPSPPSEPSLFGESVGCPVTRDGRPIGHLKARLSAGELLSGVLSLTRRDRGEIPFAIDSEGALHAAQAQDLATLRPLELNRRETSPQRGDWAVAQVKDPRSGMTFGIARPLTDSMLRLRRTALNNFLFGLGLVGLAVVGIVPLSRRITRGLSQLSVGVEALAQGDLGARVSVAGKDEVSRLAASFNRMAGELKQRELELCEQERLAKEHELERRLLAVDNERKSAELEEARSFQLSLLPKRLPQVAGLEIAVFMRTATEVGGDYYDFLAGDDGTLTVAVGDSTGHGAKAGTLVTAAKSLFVARACQAPLGTFLAEANHAIRSMELSRMAMALAVARFEGSRLTVASAGMPPVLVQRAASGEVCELSPTGMPLGAMPAAVYAEESLTLEPGDTVLLSSDGFAELLDVNGDPLGYPAAEALFRTAPQGSAQDVVDHLAQAVADRKGGAAPDDDVTFVVLRRLAK